MVSRLQQRDSKFPLKLAICYKHKGHTNDCKDVVKWEKVQMKSVEEDKTKFCMRVSFNE